MERSNSFGAQFFWLRNAELKNEIIVQLAKGANNKAVFCMKRFPPSHHKKIHPTLSVQYFSPVKKIKLFSEDKISFCSIKTSST